MHKSNDEQNHPDADFDYTGDQISRSGMVEKIRESIEEAAGDQAAILGTTADATQLLLYVLCTLTTKLSTVNSLAEVREATAEIEPMATAFLAKIESGEVKLPFMQKGLDSVVNDIQTRATAVAGVLGRIAKQNEADNPS